MNERVSLGDILYSFLKIALSSFGGGLSAWAQREFVDSKKWLTDEEFLSALALCRILPGPNMVNFAASLGTRMRGLSGAVAALAGLLVIPFFFVIAAGTLYKQYQHIAYLQPAMAGIAAAAAGMSIGMGLKLASRLTFTIQSFLIIAVTFLAIGIFRYPLLTVVAILVPISIIIASVSSHYLLKKGTRDESH